MKGTNGGVQSGNFTSLAVKLLTSIGLFTSFMKAPMKDVTQREREI